MFDDVISEDPLHFGEDGRLFGILTTPTAPARSVRDMPVFVFLSAGLLHRVGPARLHVRLARELARMGFSSFRVDLAGIGDSQKRSGLTNQESVTADYEEIIRVLETRVARLSIVMGGLCAAADNAIRLTITDQRVVGMLLLDPVCFGDDGVRASAVVARYFNPRRYSAWLKRRFKAVSVPFRERWKRIDALTFRDIPTQEQLRAAFEAIRQRDGRVLSVFTQYALHNYYDRRGQLARVVGVDGYQDFCTELFWPQAEHTFMLEVHRRQLIEKVKDWAASYIRSESEVRSACRTPSCLPGALRCDISS
jgi:hypothetical protein